MEEPSSRESRMVSIVYCDIVESTPRGVADPRVSEVMDSVREGSTQRVMVALGVPERQRAVVRAWWAYTEDRALTWSAVPTGERPVSLSELVEECVAALHALLGLRP